MRVEILFQDETFWLTINRMAELFGTSKQSISYHLQNIYKEDELQRESSVKEFLTVQIEGEREVSRNLEYYNLDAIIAIGYQVNSREATQFRIWTTQVLKEFIIKGFVLDDEHLKQGKRFVKTTLTNSWNVFVKFALLKDDSMKKLPIFMRNVVLKMQDWMQKPDAFLQFNEYEF